MANPPFKLITMRIPHLESDQILSYGAKIKLIKWVIILFVFKDRFSHTGARTKDFEVCVLSILCESDMISSRLPVVF